ncbi:hypothetical protein H072_1865 [Dactylellina haptotyla CBS 200.50]|uniref:Uncharacterized protein n=1 Tax=Dactylellina haptotyla (strain CBS 200.50) TaxID=1284197 RepID=S8AT61_DACHA|nr:hypothetical protein H072_1865 [Dactylellina haptotyla CBS 200.50]
MADPHSASTAEPAATHSSPIIREVKAKRPWPPDFSKMSDYDKYRLERKYKRRMRHAGGHPASWMKFTGILQILTVTALPAYMVLFMEWPMEHPFGPLRSWMWSKVDHLRGSKPTTTLSRGAASVENKNASAASGR